MMDIELYTVNDAGKFLGRSPDAIRELERRGLLRSIRTVGGVRLFTRSTLEREAARPKRPRGRSAEAQS